MENVATFKTSREKSTALVAIENLTPREALEMHTSVKNRGAGSVTSFINSETPYTKNQYYYYMRKLGVMPFKTRNTSNKSVAKTGDKLSQLEQKLKMLEAQIEASNISTGKRAAAIVHVAFDELNNSSRKFLGDMIAKDLPAYKMSYKQEKWLSNLEQRFIG
jgi:hypothetical protein